MGLPNFICVGAQRSGTTWLDSRLRCHKEIFLPRHKKEVHFFDRHYARGIDWYKSFFPDKEICDYGAVGEITPRYMYDRYVAKRINEHLPDCRIVFILRNPVDRAYSQYGLHIRDENVRTSFENYVSTNERLIERGMYCSQIKRYLNFYSREKIKVLIFEEVIENPIRELRSLAKFLNVNEDGFQPQKESPDYNSTYLPRFPRAKALISDFARLCRRHGFDRIVNWGKNLGMLRLFGNRGRLSPMSDEMRTQLAEIYREEIETLEEMLQINLEVWKRANQ